MQAAGLDGLIAYRASGRKFGSLKDFVLTKSSDKLRVFGIDDCGCTLALERLPNHLASTYSLWAQLETTSQAPGQGGVS